MKTVKLIINNKILCKALLCNTTLTRTLGLMLRKKLLAAVLVLPLETRFNAMVHTLFMFYKLNIYWLDRKFNIVDCKLNVKPFTFSIMPKKKAKYIIELPVNYKLKTKDKIELRFA